MARAPDPRHSEPSHSESCLVNDRRNYYRYGAIFSYEINHTFSIYPRAQTESHYPQKTAEFDEQEAGRL